MELTLDQALQKGIEAHKAGQVQDADRLYTAILKAQPKHPDANHNMGVLAVGVGKVQEALPFFKAALEANPNTAQFWLSYIDALTKLERLADAKAVFDQAKEKGAKGEAFDKLEEKLKGAGGIPNQSSNMDAAIQLRETGEFNQAIDLLKDEINRFPEDADMLALLSHCYLLADQVEEAKLHLNKAKKIDSDNASVGWNTSRLTLKEQKPLEALNVARDTSQKFPDDVEGMGVLGACLRTNGETVESLDVLNRAIELNPNYAEALINRGLIKLNQENKTEALADLELAHRLKPHIKQIWDLVVGLKVEAQEHSDAIVLLINMIEIDPEDENRLATLALCYQNLKDFDSAIAAYKKALAIKPDSAEVYNNIGNVLKEQGKLEEAIEAYSKALAIKPNSAEPYNNMGNALKEQGKLEEAIEAYNKALAIKPDYAEPAFNMGNALQDQGKLEEVIEAYKKAIAIKPGFADAYNNMGVALKAQGKLDEAIEAFIKVLAIRPDSADAYKNMGSVLKEQGKLEEAIEAYNKALAIKPDYAEAHNNMGNALQEQGKLEEAIEAFDKVLSLEPNFGEAYNDIYWPLQTIKTQISSEQELAFYYPKNKGSKYTQIATSILSYRLNQGGEHKESYLNETLSLLSTAENISIKNPIFNRNSCQPAPVLPNKIVALVHFGRSATTLLHSLIDGHPQVSTLPSIYFSEYFDHSTWEKIIAGGWDNMADRLMAIYDVLFDASSRVAIATTGKKLIYNIGQKEGMANVGDQRDEVLRVDRTLFSSELNRLMTCYDELDAFLFFRLAHAAYDRAINDMKQKSMIFYHIHNPDVYAQLNFLRSAPDTKWLMIVREPIQSCESWGHQAFSKMNHSGVANTIIHMLYEVDNSVFQSGNSIGVRLEGLKAFPKKTIPTLCTWLGIKEEDSLYKMTAQGKKWWGNPASPDYAKDGMDPFGKTSIKRKLGSVFSENDQFILRTLFYPFSVRFGYVEENQEQFKVDLQTVRPILDEMFDFEKTIVERTQANPEQFMKSGSYLYLRAGLIERWNTLNKFGTYPNMITPLELD